MTKKKDGIPEWVSAEIQGAEFSHSEELRRTGYILEFYEGDGKMDAQLYEPVEDGRHIVTLDLGPGTGMEGLEKGAVYEFVFDQHRAPLSREVSEYLASEKGLEMDAIYRFELKSLEPLDVSSPPEDPGE